MAFKRWFEELNEDIIAYPNDRGIRSSLSLSKNNLDGNTEITLSPVTTTLLNAWSFLLKSDKNLILNFQSNMLRPIPLLAYIYSKSFHKSTLIFTSGKANLKDHILRLHNQHYHLLGYPEGGFIYRNIPLGIVNNKSVTCDPYMLHANLEFRQENREIIKNKFYNSKRAKILLNGSENFTQVNKVLNKLIIDGNEFEDLNLDVDIGCIIFENADRFINTKSKAETFVEWLKDNFDKNIKFLFHFNDSNLDFLNDFKNKTNAIVLSYNNNILRNNSGLYEHSLTYFESGNTFTKNLLKNYNLDSLLNYECDHNISILEPCLEKGNLDLFLYFSQSILRQIDEKTIKNKNFYYRAINLLYSLNNLAIDPLFFKFNIQISRGNWRYITVSQFINLFRNKLSKETDSNQMLLNKLISNLNNFYHELIECKHFLDKNNYERINKSYQIFNIAFNKEDYFDDDKKLYIGTYQNTEHRILNEFLKDVPDVEAIYLRDLYFKSDNLTDYNLLLPGMITHKYRSILEHNFNQILILAYEGYNKNLINHQINLVLNPSIIAEKESMNYFDELYKFMNLSRNNQFFNDFNERYDDFINSKIVDESDKTKDDSKKVTKNIKDLFPLTDNYDEYVDGQKKSRSKLESTFSSSSSSNSYHYSTETIELNLLNLNDEMVYSKNLLKSKKYLRFKDYNKLDEAMEVQPELLKKGEFVIVLDDNKSFLDIYAEIFDEDLDLNRNFIDYWRDLLFDYKNVHNLSFKKFHELYVSYFDERVSQCGPVSYQTFRLWVNGYTICPSNPYDLKVLSELFDDDYLASHYQEMIVEGNKLRNINRNMGRKLSGIIKNIIQNSAFIDYNMLSFEERNIYNQIKDSIYQVL